MGEENNSLTDAQKQAIEQCIDFDGGGDPNAIVVLDPRGEKGKDVYTAKEFCTHDVLGSLNPNDGLPNQKSDSADIQK